MNDIIMLGIILSLIYAEFTDLSPGGIITPAYFAVYIHDPKRMLFTILIAFVCMGIVRLLSGFMILYGRRRYAVYLMVGVLLKGGLGLAGFGSMLSIGNLIPGILGREMERQKPLPTLLSLGIVTGFTALVTLLLR